MMDKGFEEKQSYQQREKEFEDFVDDANPTTKLLFAHCEMNKQGLIALKVNNDASGKLDLEHFYANPSARDFMSQYGAFTDSDLFKPLIETLGNLSEGSACVSGKIDGNDALRFAATRQQGLAMVIFNTNFAQPAIEAETLGSIEAFVSISDPVPQEIDLIQGISSTSADILLIIDIASKEVLFETRNIASDLGYEDAQLPDIEVPFFTLMHPDDRELMYDHIDNMVTALPGEVREITYRLKDHDGNYRFYRDRNTVYRRDEKGTPIEKLGIAQDITEARQAEEKIRQLNLELVEKNRELAALNAELTAFNDFAANDYAQTLKKLYTSLEQVVRQEAQQFSDTGKANMRKAQSSIQKLKLLTEDIVTFYRIPHIENQRSKVSLDSIIANLVSDELHDKLQEAQVKVDAQALPVIEGYPMLLSLLFFHLIENAVRFGSFNGAITIVYEKQNGPIEEFPYSESSAFHKITLSHKGAGFDAAHADEIFNISFRNTENVKFRNTGIGLPVVKKIMDLHRGYITASVGEDDVTQYDCYFPVSESE